MTQGKPVEIILSALEQRGQIRHEGKGWRTRCPTPDHPDQHPSFFLYPSGGGWFSQCKC
jgi:membrane protein implicated in regulation of membrane protease activity